MKVTIFDPKRHYRPLEKEFLGAAKKVLASGRLVLGEETKNFEKEFARFCSTKYGVMVNSGTSALLATLLAYEIGKGDEVITVPNTFAATVQAIIFSGAKPILVDIDPQTYNLDPNKLEKAVSKKTRAIIVVHLYGQPAEMTAINKIARKYKLIVIEDAAQAHGAKYKKKKVGNLGNAGCFSFFVTKNLPSFGTSGMVTTNSKRTAEKVRILRDNGMIKKGNHILSLNFMPEELQAAFLRIKLKKLGDWNRKRRKIANFYKKQLVNLPLILPQEEKDIYHVYYQFVVRTPQKDQLQTFLESQGVMTRTYYPIPVHLQSGFKFLGYQKGSFPEAEKTSQQILSLPLYPELKQTELEFTVKQIKKFFRT
ncbi:hypothetical protein AMJ51_01910 [Microgenomates bacterium DG_75]|nr:MAG: hypothetical protein AMJ51_01910 [Microgenomates bacterium DG_75]